MKKYKYLLLVVLVLASCNKKNEVKIAHEYAVQGDTIIVSKGSSLVSKIKTAITKEQMYYQSFSTSGEVEAIPTDYAEIASPFAGRITRSLVKLGQKVFAGSPVFEISSPDFFETSRNYYQAQQEMKLADKRLKREKDLIKNKVGVEKEVEEAELNYALKKKDYENAKAALSVYRVNPDKLVLGQPLIVRSPIAGEVVKSNIVMGQYLKEDAEPVAIIANLDKVWVVAHVKEKDVKLIRNLSEVKISLVAYPEKVFKGRIYHINEMMDPDTRSVEVLIECNNTNRLMKPGMYGFVKLTDEPLHKIIIPASAVLQAEDSTYVFVCIGENEYKRRNVVTASTQDDGVVVISGLQPNDKIITQGAFYLNEAR